MITQHRPLLLSVLLAVTFVTQLRAAPPSPTNLVANVNGNTVSLTWSGPAAFITGYRLEAGTAPGLTNAANTIVGISASFTATAVPAGTYYVRVRAIAPDGESAPSNEAIVVVSGGGSGCNTAPGVPGALSASVNGSLVSFSWAQASGCAPTHYVLYAGSFSGGSDIAIVNVGKVQGFSASAPPGTYYVYLVAVNGNGASLPSNVVTVLVGGATPPPTPGPAPPPPAGTVEVNLNTASIGSSFSGNGVVIGEVINRSANTVAFTQVTAAFRNAAGATVGTDSTYISGRSRRLSSSGIVTDTTLAPGESGCFYMLTNIPRPSISRVVLDVQFDVRSTSALAGFPMMEGAPTRRSSLGDLRLSGTMRNNGSALTYFNKAVFYIQRADGLAVDCDFTYIDGAAVRLSSGITTDTGLAPGQAGTYDAFTSAPDTATSITSWTQWDEGRGSLADEVEHAHLELMMMQADGDALAKQRSRELWETLERTRHEADQRLRAPQ